MALDVAVVLLALVAGTVAFGRLRPVPVGRHPGTGPPVVVVIPSRDEEDRLPGLLSDLTRPGEVPQRIVVVDDHSRDATASVASRVEGVDVVAAPPVPPGWLPKSWACHVGAAGAPADAVLVFLDADVRLAPGALDAVVAEVETRGGLVSVAPRHRLPRLHEQLSAFFAVVAVMGSGAGHRRPTGAFGPVMAATVADHRAVGGHASVADELVEDLALARRHRAAGHPVTILDGGPAVTWRMYPGSVRDVWQGWSKNVATGAVHTPPPIAAAIAAWVTALCVVALGWVGLGPLGDRPLVVVAALWGTAVVQLRWCQRRVADVRWATTLAYPIPLVFFIVVCARSAVLTLLGAPVAWRGRNLPSRRPLRAGR